MKTLITGATGFVGYAVLRQLLDEEHEVRAVLLPLPVRGVNPTEDGQAPGTGFGMDGAPCS